MMSLRGASIAALIFVSGVSPDRLDAQAALHPVKVARWVPEFSLQQAIYTPLNGQYSLSADGTHAVHSVVGRYFGHPLIPDFGRRNNLTLVRLEDGETKVLTSGTYPKNNPRFSPDGRTVAFESHENIWSVDIRTGETRQLSLSPASDRSPVWSPDGREIAFVSGRRGGSADRTGSRIWAMPAAGELEGLRVIADRPMGFQDLQWSPDGRWILFTASPGGEPEYSSAIFVISAAGGEPPRRLTPEDGFEYNSGRWSPDGSRIALLSDRSGFLNIWMMDPDGDDLRPMTTEELEHHWTHRDYANDTPVWSPDGTRLLYYVNRDGNCDLRSLHVATRRQTARSSEDGCHHPLGWVGNDAVAFIFEDYHTPPDLYVRPLASGPPRQVTHSSHVTFRKEAFGSFERVSFRSRDGLEIHGNLLLPPDAAPPERLPGVIMLHTYNPGSFYNWFNPIFNFIVGSGYAMLQVDQRGSVGYGRDFTLASIGEWGGKQVDDVAAGAAFLARHPVVSRERLGVMGYSFGGYQTYWAVIKTPELFRAGVSIFGPADRRNRPQPSDRWELHIGGPEREFPALWDAASPAAQVDRIEDPLLIIGGAEDRIVHVGQTYRMAAELKRAGKEYELLMYPDEEHGLKHLDHQLDSVERIIAFLDRHLKD